MIPKYNEMYRELLEVLQRKESWTKKELQEAMAKELKISLEERNLRYESGAKIYINRIEWACVYLKKAGLVESVKRGVIRITDKGKKLLKSNFNLMGKKSPTSIGGAMNCLIYNFMIY